MNHTVNTTWGQRVKVCNMFPTVGSLDEMRRSRIIRGLLVENVDAKALSTNAITKNACGKWEIPEKNEERSCEITLGDAELAMFAEFITVLSDKKQVPMIFVAFFSAIIELYNENTTEEEK